jgi:trehalose 6-phosphate phosphatase
MKDFFEGNNLRELDRFARDRLLVALDYDGTLAPIVRDRRHAVMRQRTRELLAQVARIYPTAVITGRARKDLAPLVAEIPLACTVGNHGAEWGKRDARTKRLVTRWRRALRTLRGVDIENKGYSLALHYRRARDKRRARAAIMSAVGRLPQVRIATGKQVINLLPARAPDKGQALLKLIEDLRCDAAIFIGDDVTDEDAFALDQPRLLTVRVGHRRDSLARFFIERQRDIDHLLQALSQAHARRAAFA